MKKIFLLLINLSVFFNVYPQTLEKTFRFQFESTINQILSDGQSGWFIGGYYKRFDQASSPPWVCRVDSLGHIMWTNTLVQPGLEEGVVRLATRTEDQGLVVSGRLMSCDAGPDASFVRKINLAGLTEWSYIWSESMNPLSGFFNAIVESTDNGVLIARDSLILKLSSHGDSLWTRSPSNGWIHSLIPLTNGDLIVGSNNGLSRTDSLGSLQFSRPFLHPVRKVSIDNLGRLNVLSNNILFRLDTYLNMVDSIDINPWFSSINDMQLDSNRIWLLGIPNSGTMGHLLILDSNLNFLSMNPSGPLGTISSSLAFNQNQIIFAGWQEDVTAKTAYIKTADKNGNSSISSTDASIADISIVNYYLVPINVQLPGIVDVFMDIDVNVINRGQDTIRSVFLNAELNFGFICFKAKKFKEFAGINILPGDTAKIRFNGLRDYARDVNDLFSFAVWTSDPNRKLDQNILNDSIVYSFFLTGIKTEKTNSFLVYPNPSREQFHILSNDNERPDEIKIYSVNGNLILNKKNDQQGILTIDWDEQAGKGIYLLEIISGSKVYRSKLIRH